MKRTNIGFVVLLISVLAWAQRPTNPALLIPQNAPELDYLPVANPVTLPSGVMPGSPASVAFDSKGHMFVFYRGAQPLIEFEADGKFIRGVGDGLSFTRAHGMRIDSEDNIWVTDVGAHLVMKLNPQGQVLLTLGTKGEAGDWNEAAQARHLNEPNDLAIGRNGDIFVVQGHTPGRGDPRVLKFDSKGNFVKSWGGKGTEPGKFDVAHGIAIDSKGLLWVADRENQRIQIFDQDGKFVRQFEICRLTLQLTNWPAVHLHGQRICGSTPAAGSGRQCLGRCRKTGQGSRRIRGGPRDCRKPEGGDLHCRHGQKHSA
jgi:NHL repeat